MLTPKELTFQGIGRFVSPQKVKFDAMGNLVQVDGENRNTSGSSGSGKSTFFNALEFNLGLNDLPATVLQSRLTKDGIMTVGNYDWDGKNVTLTRGKGSLSILIDGVLTEGSNKLVEEKIDEMLGMSRELFRPILHKRQKEGGFFLKMTPSKVHEFLTNCLGLSAYKTKLDIVDEKVAFWEDAKIANEAELGKARAGLIATQDAILGLGLEPVQDIHQEVVDDLKAKYDVSNGALTIVVHSHANQLKIIEAQKPTLHPNPELIVAPVDPPPILEDTSWNMAQINSHEANIRLATGEIARLSSEDTERIKEVTQAIQTRKLIVSSLTHSCSLASQAQTDAMNVGRQIKRIRDSICPTCEQNWVTETAKIKESEYLAQLNELRQKIIQGATAEQSISKTNIEISSLETELAPKHTELIATLNKEISALKLSIDLEKEKATLHKKEVELRNRSAQEAHSVKTQRDAIATSSLNQKALNQVAAKNKALTDAYDAKKNALILDQKIEIEQLRGQADVDRRSYESAKTKLDLFIAAKNTFNSSIKTLRMQEKSYADTVSARTNDVQAAERSLSLAKEAKRAIKSFMSCSFDDALDEISAKSTEIIRGVPTMVNVTIRLEGLRETAAGKIKEEVNAVMSMDGDENIDIRSLSGGERSAADLAIDLAVIDLIENRSNKGVSLFILDEPFNGLGTPEIEPILEMLKVLKTTKKLILVEHNPEVKQMVESRLVAVREGLYSNLMQ